MKPLWKNSPFAFFEETFGGISVEPSEKNLGKLLEKFRRKIPWENSDNNNGEIDEMDEEIETWA